MRRYPIPDTRYPSSDSGFTLIELLVAIGLFSILVAIAAGGFVSALRTQRAVAAMMAAQSNVSIALEQMTREMRTGYLFCNDVANNGQPSSACFEPCTVNGGTQTWTCTNFLEFYNANSEKVDYSLVNGVIERSVDGGAPQAITADTVQIPYLTFTLFGNTEGDHWNPRITVAVGVNPNDATVNWNTTSLQTSISAREIDCTSGSSPSC